MTRSPAERISQAELNRATLARQGLLEPLDLDPVAALEAFGGLQAQEPAAPFVGLWSRLRRFDPADLDRAFRERRAIKATLMRGTLHAVSRRDYVHLVRAMEPLLRRKSSPLRGPRLTTAELDRLADAALAFAAEPRANVELRDHVNGLADLPPPRDAWWFVNGYASFVHLPLDEPWTFGRRPRYVAAPAWLEGESLPSAGAAAVHLVRRYLGAFGPASVADAAAWSRLPIGHLRAATEALDRGGELARFGDAAGRELFDLVDAPRPPADVPAPPRLLPMWDSTILAYADRTRVISDADRAVVIARNGDTLPTFLVDGRVAGLWWAEAGESDRATRIVLEPFRDLDPATRAALEREGERLASFVGPIEPRVFARYRGSLARRGR